MAVSTTVNVLAEEKIKIFKCKKKRKRKHSRVYLVHICSMSTTVYSIVNSSCKGSSYFRKARTALKDPIMQTYMQAHTFGRLLALLHSIP